MSSRSRHDGVSGREMERTVLVVAYEIRSRPTMIY
jgi:hypothetical protein